MEDMKDLYTENSMSLKEIEDLNKWSIPDSWIRKSNTKYH